MKVFVLAACLLLFSLVAHAQPYERQVQPFFVMDDVAAYDNPFLGGIAVPRLQFVDIDADGDADLFVQETDGNLTFFENTGTPQQAAFAWRTDAYKGLEIGQWARFADVDADGDPDLLAEQPSGRIRYYQNMGTPEEAQFTLTTDILQDPLGNPITADPTNVPALADIDCDGLPDLFAATTNGHLVYYSHTGIDATGSPLFDPISQQYQGLEIIGDFSGKHATAALHGANAITFGDVDDNGTTDLFWGDFFSPSLYFIQNTGTCAAPQLERIADVFPRSAPLMTTGHNAPAFTDIDADGDLDLFAGVLGGSFGISQNAINNTFFYEQQADGSFTLRTERYLTTLDVGSDATPAFADLDADGDLDLLVGHKINPATSNGTNLAFFRNEGTATMPAFRLVDADLLTLSNFNIAPALADIDADGDVDLLIGGFLGEVAYYRNDGTSTAANFVLADDQLLTLRDTPSSGNFATPTLADLDADGDLDLFIGESAGTINYYRNDGTAASPAFTLVTDTFGSIDAGSRSAPTFRDLDADGDLDLIIGTEGAGLVAYRNTGTPQVASFSLEPTLGLPAPTSLLLTPAFADINGDGDDDVFVGTRRGGLLYFDNRRISTVIEAPPERLTVRFLTSHPNPFRNLTTIQFALDHPAAVRLVVYDVLGRAVETLVDNWSHAGQHEVIFDKTLPPGVYFISLTVGDQPPVTRSLVRM